MNEEEVDLPKAVQLVRSEPSRPGLAGFPGLQRLLVLPKYSVYLFVCLFDYSQAGFESVSHPTMLTMFSLFELFQIALYWFFPCKPLTGLRLFVFILYDFITFSYIRCIKMAKGLVRSFSSLVLKSFLPDSRGMG